MKGFETLWMPGTDHAGIATQTVVDKRLQEEGKPSIRDLKLAPGGRETFIQHVQAFKDEYESVITEQLKRMGCSCDWDRQRFTMDDVCARAVREAFFRLFKEGLIYRGKRLVNWDPATQTALADDEVEMREIDGHFWYLRYPLVHKGEAGDHQPVTWSELARLGYPGANRQGDDDPAWVTVATTRPETYLGDTGVAVNPNDPRAKPLKGLHVELPIVGRVIPIIEDDYVVMPDADSADPKAKYATGFLKVTPAHDANDWAIGQRHALEVVNVLAPDASISDQHGWDREARGENGHIFVGKSREEARRLVVKEFESRALLEATKPYQHSIGHSYRSHVAIEPYLSDQWYVKVTDDSLVGEAQRALADEQRSTDTYTARRHKGTEAQSDGKLRFFPERYAKSYESWHDNLRDWCISRQLWWGHRIPVWHKRAFLTEQNWADELAGEAGLDDIIDGTWSTAHARFVRVSDGTDVDPTKDLRPVVAETECEYDIFVCAKSDDEMRQLEATGYQQDPDVLDTWFSSALWPISTMGWPDPSQDPHFDGLLDAFNPTSVLCTAREIITLWVSRMVMFNRHFLDNSRLPFHHAYIHPMIQDGHGQRMSKSLGNGVDPLDIIATHGADALRMVLAGIATTTQDVRMPVDLICPHCTSVVEPKWITSPAGYRVPAPEQNCPKCAKHMITGYAIASAKAKPSADAPLAANTSSRFDDGQKFCNKLWNAARFAMMMLAGQQVGQVSDLSPETARRPVPPSDLPLADRWMLSRLARAASDIDKAIDTYQFSIYASTCYDLFWRDFCDWYLESIKPTVADNPAQRAALRATLDAILRLLHPIIPFVTETIYEQVRTIPGADLHGLTLGEPETDALLCTAPWPRIDASWINSEAESEYERLQTLVKTIRDVRAQHKVPPKRRIILHAPKALAAELAQIGPLIRPLALVDSLDDASPPAGAVAFRFDDHELHLSDLADAVDAGTERDRLAARIEELEKSIQTLSGRLNNPGYTQKAPEKLVSQTRDQLEKAKADRDAAALALERLG
jgi:valyl-tRNA synthetase